MKITFKKFFRDENGAVSVDWVVLTASVLFLAIAIGVAVRESTIETAATLAEHVASRPTE